jgi:two-component system, OmpR family, response regulator
MTDAHEGIDVLLIEDDERLAQLTARYLEQHGLRVTVRLDGTTGYQEAIDHKYDCILLDRMLPGRNGLDICRDLRARGPVPIIILSAQSGEDEKAAGLLAGADEYTTKPFSARNLLDRVRAIVQRSRRSDAAGIA